MNAQEHLTGIVEKELDGMGYELVKLDVGSSGRKRILRVYIDSPSAKVTIEDCVRVTRALGLVLEELDSVSSPYNLEVSSPGLERPLKKLADFERFSGQPVKIKTCRACDPDGRGQNRKVFVGVLKAVRDGQILLLQSDSKGGEVAFELKDIDKANLVFEF